MNVDSAQKSIDQRAPDASRIVQQFMALSAIALDPKQVGEAWFAAVPKDYELRDITAQIEKAQPAPSRKRDTILLASIPSLMAYAADQAMDEVGYIYADPDARTITAVFNDHKAADYAGWRDHRAIFKAEFTTEFGTWFGMDGKPFGQTEFAEFIESNFADLADADAQTLLNVATTIQATTGIDFRSAKRLQDGQVQLTYQEIIDAKAGADGALKIPQTFTLGLRVFKRGEGYKLKARLKYRLHSGNIKFWFELDRPERAIEDAFSGYVKELQEKSGYTVLIGKP